MPLALNWHPRGAPWNAGEKVLPVPLALPLPPAFVPFSAVLSLCPTPLPQVPSMLRKDASLARYPDFAEWKARSWLFIPGVV